MTDVFNFSALATANPYVLPPPLLYLVGGNSGAPDAFQVVNGLGIKMGTFGPGFAWAVHDVEYGNLITSEIVLGNLALGGDNPGAGIFIRSGAGAGDGYIAYVTSINISIYVQPAVGSGTLLVQTAITPDVGDTFELSFNQTTGDLEAFQNGISLLSVTDTTYTAPQRALMGPGFYLEWGNENAQCISIFAGTGAAAPTLLSIGGLVARQRPIGRGPQMNRTRAAFKRSQGSQATRQVVLQLFSSPGVPLANASVTFFTAYDDAGAAIDGPMVRVTDSSGYVRLVGLNIAAIAGNIRYQITGDPTKHRVSAVNFVI